MVAQLSGRKAPLFRTLFTIKHVIPFAAKILELGNRPGQRWYLEEELHFHANREIKEKAFSTFTVMVDYLESVCRESFKLLNTVLYTFYECLYGLLQMWLQQYDPYKEKGNCDALQSVCVDIMIATLCAEV